MRLIERVTSDAVIEAAYEWLCDRRHDYHHNNDVWQLQRWWTEKKPPVGGATAGGNLSLWRTAVVRALGEVKKIWAPLLLMKPSGASATAVGVATGNKGYQPGVGCLIFLVARSRLIFFLGYKASAFIFFPSLVLVSILFSPL
ncbi:hypothetical protein [Nostoc sp. ChiQUE01b]|uniref:hypothetical protein n=1 Tax=Nostoc sp. ChiQUE01b TaxID=3075376 RepID=UPI002AD41C1D|nr:hypothetical protein [Nostoc sp. ChiQUE01b]MDZ8263322.1 hypothetical protein [Nostoc sp. ChiQUE01b]